MAKKLESTLMNMTLSLVFISMGMSAALTLVYLKTKEPIEAASIQKEINSVKQVLPEFDGNPTENIIEKDGVKIYYPYKQNQIVGFAIKTFTNKGFGGKIELMAGFLPDGTIYNITVLQHKETPGLGTKMTDEKFKSQFLGKNPENYYLKVKKDGGKVDAITAATVSSRAYCDAIQRAYNTLTQINDSVTSKQ